MNWFAWALLSALFAALTAILAKLGVASLNANLATAIRTTIVVVFTWGIAAWTTNAADWRHLGLRTWIFLIASGMATGLSWLCYFQALKLGSVSQVAPVDKLSVALALILAWGLLGEKLQTQEAVGAALVVLGVVVMVVKF